MREFASLYDELDATTSTTRKLAALKCYFRRAQPANAAWAIYFLAGGKPRQIVPAKLLRQFPAEMAGIPEWLFDECYQSVGDLAGETIAHILPPPCHRKRSRAGGMDGTASSPFARQVPEVIRTALFTYWNELDTQERFLFVKLISGSFRVGVSKLLVIRALSEIAGVDKKIIAQRMMGWTEGTTLPDPDRYNRLLAVQAESDDLMQGGQPYPFFLAHPLQTEPQALGDIWQWQAEWKYDGIRAQLVQRSEAANDGCGRAARS